MEKRAFSVGSTYSRGKGDRLLPGAIESESSRQK